MNAKGKSYKPTLKLKSLQICAPFSKRFVLHKKYSILVLLVFLILPFQNFTDSQQLRTSLVLTTNSPGPSHFIKFQNGVQLGFSEKGGGFINHGTWHGSENFVAPLFGRGWQVAIRDFLHSGRYNPTQAGSTDYQGAQTDLISLHGGKTIRVKPFRMPLFQDHGYYDFVKNENNWFQDWNTSDSGSSDHDAYNDYNLPHYLDEVTSEFDMWLTHQNLSHLSDSPQRIAILRTKYNLAFLRNPKALKQFIHGRLALNETPVLKSRFRFYGNFDISKQLNGVQSTGPYDLSIINHSDGIRFSVPHRRTSRQGSISIYGNQGFSDTFDINLLPQGQDYKNRYTRLIKTNTQISNNFLTTRVPAIKKIRNDLSKRLKKSLNHPKFKLNHMELRNNDKDLFVYGLQADQYVGYYLPPTNINKRSVYAYDRQSKKLIYEDDRNLFLSREAHHPVNELAGFFHRKYVAGLLSPSNLKDELKKNGNLSKFKLSPQVQPYEALRQEVFVIFAPTRREVLQTRNKLRQALKIRDQKTAVCNMEKYKSTLHNVSSHVWNKMNLARKKNFIKTHWSLYGKYEQRCRPNFIRKEI